MGIQKLDVSSGSFPKNIKSLSSEIKESEIREKELGLSSEGKSYQVTFSNGQMEREKALSLALNEPDLFRKDKVDALKSDLAEGRYPLNGEKIAEGLLREIFQDSWALNLHYYENSRAGD